MKKKPVDLLHDWNQLRQKKGQAQADTPPVLQELWQHADAFPAGFDPDVEAGLGRLKSRIQADAPTAKVVRMSPVVRYLRMAAAAVAIGVLGWGAWLYVADAPAAWVEVRTGPDEKRTIVLPDQSEIVLNGQSTLRYAANMDAADQREVVLSGEAYFDVARRPDQPFVIKTSRTEITVLGTAFNVRAYSAEAATEVEVTHGSVAVKDLVQQATVVLKAKEAAIQHPDQPIVKTAAPHLNRQSWRTGKFYFKETPLHEVLTTLERHYNVAIVRDEAAIAACVLTTTVRQESLTNVLATIETLTGATFTASPNDAQTYRLQKACR